MDIELFREYCLSLPMVTEEFPFDETTLVFKVAGKMFALTDLEQPFAIALKCQPEYAIELREHHANIQGAYHMNKKHWNTVYDAAIMDDSFLKQLIDLSYKLVAAGLPLKFRRELGLVK